MKKFHKRAAVFLTAATLAGLPAGAFFYSSPGSLTVWADKGLPLQNPKAGRQIRQP